MEPLERRILMTWIGATTGNTNDASHLYNNTANWAGGVIDNSFAGVTFTGNTTLFFNAGVTTGGTGLNLGYSGNFSLTLESSSTTTQTLTLGGGISGAFGGSSVTIGNASNNLNVDLGATGQTFTVSAGDTLSILNVISDAGSLTKAGAGTLTVSGANLYSGGTTLSAGQLNIDSATAIGSGTLAINGGTIDNASGGVLTLSSNNAIAVGASFTFAGSNNLNLGTGAVTLGLTPTITTTAGNLTVGGTVSGAFGVTKAGNGTLTLSGANNYSGQTTLSAGQININSATALGTGTFDPNGGSIDNTSGASITMTANNAMLWNSNLTFVGSNALNLGTGTATMSANHTITTTANTLTIGGVVSGAFLLTKAGAGTLVLTGTNTFSNGLTLSGGVLALNNAAATGTGTFTIGNGTSVDNTSGSAITLSNNNAVTMSNFTFVGTNNLNFGTGAVTITGNRTVTVTAGNLTIGGAIGQTGGARKLTEAGNGTLTLSGTNTYSGGFTLSTGQININNAAAVGSGTFTISGGTIDNTSGAAITLSNNNVQSWGEFYVYR